MIASANPHDALLAQTGAYYTRKLRAFGPSPQGVDWNSAESQGLRFLQLLKVRDHDDGTLLDYGCGYGALLDHVAAWGYQGYDVAPAMIEAARARHPEAAFTHQRDEVRPADHVIASGVFNVKEAASIADWKEHVLSCLDEIAGVARRGFAFNMLTSYSDPDRMRDDLYYADPCFYFDMCKRRYSRQVALLHDYGLFEFTLLVRLEGRS